GPLISDLDISPELNKRYGAYKFRANFRHLLEEIKELQGEACDKAQTQLIENYKFLGWVVFKHFERANLALVSTIEERLYIDLNKLLKETSDKFNVSHSYGQ
ncbi:hypothetical protein HN510_00150, partial [Candidatus Woesearchaeota archaeon]|nr:hypothetical protein [Candidatus Woesearchaeota archaeon]